MNTSWQSLHSSLTRSTALLSFQRQFELLRQSNRTLERFCDPTALLDQLHAIDGDPADKNEIIAALIRAIQSRTEWASPATTLLWLALWPGLDALLRRLLLHCCSPEDLVSEIADRLTREMHRIDLTRVRRIAATVLRNIERDIRQSLGSSRREARMLCELTDGIMAVSASGAASCGRHRSLLGLPAGLDLDEGAAIICARLRPCLGEDAALIIAVAVRSDPQAEAARRLGLGYEAGRKRYQRALHRLRGEIATLA